MKEERTFHPRKKKKKKGTMFVILKNRSLPQPATRETIVKTESVRLTIRREVKKKQKKKKINTDEKKRCSLIPR